MAKQASKKRGEKTFPFWTLIIVPIITLIPVYWEKIVGEKDEKPSETITVYQDLRSGDTTRQQPTAESPPVKEQAKNPPPEEHIFNNEGTLQITITPPVKEITVQCTNCQTFLPQPEKLVKSGTIRFKFSVKDQDDPSQSINLIIYKGDQSEPLNVNIHNPHSNITL